MVRFNVAVPLLELLKHEVRKREWSDGAGIWLTRTSAIHWFLEISSHQLSPELLPDSTGPESAGISTSRSVFCKDDA